MNEKKPTPWKKILLGCGCASLLTLALCGGIFTYMVMNAYTMDPPVVVERAKGILPGATFPDGYEGRLAIQVPFVGVKMAFLSPEAFTQGQQELTGMVCMLMEIPTADATQAKMQMQTQMQTQSGQQGGETEILDSETVTVGGKEVVLHKMRQTNPSGSKMLQMMVLLPGTSSTAIAMFMGPEDKFDRAALDAFLASIPAKGE